MVQQHTGAIWELIAVEQRREVEHVSAAVTRAYGSPRLGNPADPLDDLVFIMLSNKTSPAVAQRVYEAVRLRYPTWDDVLVTRDRRSSLHELLRPAGLSLVKSHQILDALEKIARDFGRCDLAALRARSTPEVLHYLKSLPGVSDKVARCVAMYTLSAQVLPVDAHVYRIASRIGWVVRNRAAQCHAELEELIPPSLRHDVHVNFVALGRDTCRVRNPHCRDCVVSRYCRSAFAA